MPGGQNLVITLLGMKGSGKSTLLRELVREWKRVVIIDSMAEHDDLPGAIVREGPEACTTAIIAYKKVPKFLIDCILDDPEDVNTVLAVAFEIPGLLICIDEASYWCNPYFIPPEISKLIRYGRKREIDLIFVARRPSEIHRDLTAQSDLLVTFKQTEPTDLAYLRARMGPDGDKAAHLAEFHVLVAGDVERIPLPVLQRMENIDLTSPDEPQ